MSDCIWGRLGLAGTLLTAACAAQPPVDAPPPAGPAAVPPPMAKASPPAIAPAVRHPLDPLDASELEAAVTVLRDAGKLGEGVFFPILVLREPPKELVKRPAAADSIPREAFAVLLDRKIGKTYEAVVDVSAKTVVSFIEVPGVQPGVLIDEFSTPAALVKADPRWQAAMKKRGITDFENVQVDTWGAGILSPAERKSGRRLIRTLSYYRGEGGTNPYAKPIEGVVVVVDVGKIEIVEVIDTGVVPVSTVNGRLEPASIGAQRQAPKPLYITQPEGSSFSVEGWQVRWQKWRFSIGMHPREGVTIHQARYVDGDTERSVLYRGSLSEMVVPYGDTDGNWVWRNAFDLGEYGVGRLATTLRAGLESPQNAAFLDATFADDFGKAYVQPSAIAIWERDAGMLWKHFDFDTGHDETRRERQLVVQYVATIGNYDYGINWVFTQNGEIMVEAELTGIMLPKGVAAAKSDGVSGTGPERFGRMVSPHIVAPNHQHFFNFRLDLDIDGEKNSLVQLDNHALPKGKPNAFFNAFELRETRPKSELASRSDMNMHTHRFWRVINPTTFSALGHPTGYQIMPGMGAMPYLYPESIVRKRAGFIDYHIWATRHHPEEMNAGGYYPNQSNTAEGLTKWVQNDESIDGEDLVLWYTFGVTHNPRPEEWPVMSVHRTGFMLMPDGFFSRNPAMDVPPPATPK